MFCGLLLSFTAHNACKLGIGGNIRVEKEEPLLIIQENLHCSQQHNQ